MGTKPRGKRKSPHKKTPTFLLELPLVVEAGQAARQRAHLEAGRQFYNAVLSAGQRRLRQMRADPAWQVARAIPRTHTQERRAAFSALRERYGFSEYAFHELARELRVSWLAEHLDAVLAQTLATRAYRALNRVCVGKARRVRFKSRGRGLSSIENKRNDTGLRFVLETPEEGHRWLPDLARRPAARAHRLGGPGGRPWSGAPGQVRSAGAPPRLQPTRTGRRPRGRSLRRATGARRRALPQAQARSRPRHRGPGPGTVQHRHRAAGRRGPARAAVCGTASRCASYPPHATAHGAAAACRQSGALRRAGSAQEARHRCPRWKQSHGYQVSRRRLAARERRLAAHRKSLHGRLAHQIVAVGHTIITEKLSYQGWQKRYGKSVGLRAPGMLIAHLKRTVASTGGTLHEVPTRSTKLSQYCHGCGTFVTKPLSQRWHQCPCGIGPVQRDLYSAFLAAYLDPADPIPSCARYRRYWEGAEARLQAAHERAIQRAKEGQVLPRSMGIPRAGARLPKSPSEATQELLFLSRRGKVEAWKHRPEPPVLQPGEP